MIEELPTLIDAAMSIFMNVISEFVLGRKVLVGRITKELLSLMDVSDFNNLEKKVLCTMKSNNTYTCFSLTHRYTNDGYRK